MALHTWTHHPLTSLSNEQIVAEIVYNAAIVYEATGKVPLHFRPPYGDMDDRVRAIVTALGLRTIYWTTTPSRDSGDTNRSGFPTVAAVVSYVVSWWETFTNSAGFISLSHDISSFTVEAGIKSIQAIQAAQSTGTFSLKPQPVGTCVGLQQSTSWYFAGATQPTASTSSSTTRPTTPPPAINGASGNTVAMTILALVFASFLIQVLF